MRIQHVTRKLEQLLSLSKNIANSYDNLVKVEPTHLSNQRIQTRLSDLKETWSQFRIFHTAVMGSIPELSVEEQRTIHEHAYFTEEIYDTTKEVYLDSLEKFTSLADYEHDSAIEVFSNSATSLPNNRPIYFQHTKLPHLKIPQFNGNLEEWLPFKNLFESLVISNHSLSAIEKLQYLKTHLTGAAFNLVKHTTLTADNFQKTWDSLTEFYENSRVLINTALQSLFNLKRVTKESGTEIQQLYSDFMQLYRTFETLKCPIEHWDLILIYICTQKLDVKSNKLWEAHLGSAKKPPSWKQFHDFLFSRMSSLQSFEKSHQKGILQSIKQLSAKVHHQSKFTESPSDYKANCVLCKEDHYIAFCPKYSSKSIQQKLDIVSKYKLCFNCLGNHRVSKCRVTKRCQKCGNKHHTTIHHTKIQSQFKKRENTENQKENLAEPSTKSEAKVLHSYSDTSMGASILLATAKVIVVSALGQVIKLRALVDQGSEVSIVTERVVQQLNLPRSHSSISLTGIGAQKVKRTKGITSFILRPYFESNYEAQVRAYILPKLTTSIPSCSHNKDSWSHLKSLTLADPEFHKTGTIDLIIGAEVYSQIIEEGIIKGVPNTPIAQSTKLGWIISGATSHNTINNRAQGYHVSVREDLHDLLRHFWETEEILTATKTLSRDEQECENQFKATHSRDATGRYIVKLPFKDSADKLGDSKSKAFRQMTNLQHKFSSNESYAKLYKEFIEEYEQLNHMKRVENTQCEPEKVYYLPHHGVYREHSLSTKLRVVFNGSSKTTTGYSLNQILHSGAKLQLNLFNVLIWFRMFQYVFFADIEKMYRQIQVHPSDWNYQRIIWIESLGNLIIYTLRTVTYGLICAPFLALRTFEQLILDEGHRFPLALPTMKKGRYVDDFFGGEDTLECTRKVVEQVNNFCMAGGFPLKKWVSNNPEVLSSIPSDQRLDTSAVQIDEAPIIRTLGLSWHPDVDQFRFTLNLEEPKIISKRTILSTISKIFDPLGFLSPITITGRILIQELWSSGLDWDEKLPPTLINKWQQFIGQLREASGFTFPRWIGFNSVSSFEMHGFSDASQHAIAAIVYLRSHSNDSLITITLIASKTKVAPLKRLTIPRLELMGAVLLVKLMQSILITIERPNMPLFAWIDSQVAHTWINNHPSRWKDFVHNRVCFIQDTLPQCKWGLVSGKDNPADLATRGISPSQLNENTMWWSGPEWLSLTNSAWPQGSAPLITEHLEERKREVSTFITNKHYEIWDILSRYSNLTTLLRVTALCRKFIRRTNKKTTSVPITSISVKDINHEKLFWIKTVQCFSFSFEIKVISQGQTLSKSNPLVRLTPYIDSEGLLRVSGRLQQSLLTDDAKHPYIIPKDSPFTQLVISDAHSRTLHGGTQMTLAYLRQTYWIVGGRVAVKSFILKCIKCTRFRQQRAQQLMGQLPLHRVVPSRPFLHSGVDYAGPFSIKTWKGRNAKTYKGYISLFVCFATSAIHLELVTDYTSDAFLAAYRRFTARRGICATLTSDCGTNFLGANKELKRLFSSASKEWKSISSILSNDGTQWKFNPPSAPHFGGKWEAGVKSVKFHLKRTIGDTLLTYEEFTTVLSQIEAVLNSRPLCTLSDDPDELSILTPGHFLIGTSLATIPESTLSLVKTSHLSRWQLLQQKLEHFWAHWSKEYLQRQLSIYKWNKVNPSIAIGSIVLVVDERYPPSKWPLGRVVETHAGPDGHVRVVTVKTQFSEFKRPITKVCPLDVGST